MNNYILNSDKEPIEATLAECERFMEDPTACIVKEDYIGKIFNVATHFLPVGHPSSTSMPFLFETMIFDLRTGAEALKEDIGAMSSCYRTSSYSNAVALHNRVLISLADILLADILEEEAFTFCET